MRLTAVFTPPAGFARIGIATTGERLCGLRWLDDAEEPRVGQDVVPAFTATVLDQLAAYFTDAHWRFSLPLQLEGSLFQQRVWQALADIPVGTTCSYSALAQCLRTSARAIGGACRRNPIPIILPCHRVVAIAGPGGYCGRTSGEPLAIKRRLLAHEGADQDLLL